MRRNVIVIGASAGGVETLRTVVAGLPVDLDAAVLIVLHVPPLGSSRLPAILSRAGHLEVTHAVADEPLTSGVIRVAPPDRHVVVRDGHVVLTHGPRENGHRPSVDVLFRSAARALGPRVIGVVLSGARDDGTAGLSAIRARGGVTVVQDPEDAAYSGMPENAIEHGVVDHVRPADEIAELLVRLCSEQLPDDEPGPVSDLMQMETDLAALDDAAMNRSGRPGVPSGFSCPDCHGVLWQVEGYPLVRYRCRVGHAWTADALMTEQNEQLESALWMALRGLEEKAALSRMMHDRARQLDHALSARRFAEQASEATDAASLIRQLLEVRAGVPERDDEQVEE